MVVEPGKQYTPNNFKLPLQRSLNSRIRDKYVRISYSCVTHFGEIVFRILLPVPL